MMLINDELFKRIDSFFEIIVNFIALKRTHVKLTFTTKTNRRSWIL